MRCNVEAAVRLEGYVTHSDLSDLMMTQIESAEATTLLGLPDDQPLLVSGSAVKGERSESRSDAEGAFDGRTETKIIDQRGGRDPSGVMELPLARTARDARPRSYPAHRALGVFGFALRVAALADENGGSGPVTSTHAGRLVAGDAGQVGGGRVVIAACGVNLDVSA